MAAYWLFKQGETIWAGVLVAWFLLVVGTIGDNVVKSLVIGRNSPLPISLILFGVIGGAIAFGMLVFSSGPTLLALFYTLIRNWVNKRCRRTSLGGGQSRGWLHLAGFSVLIANALRGPFYGELARVGLSVRVTRRFCALPAAVLLLATG